MSSAALAVPASIHRRLCRRCAKVTATNLSISCNFDKVASKKCSYCREKNKACTPLSRALVRRGLRLLRLQRVSRTAPGSALRQSKFRAAIAKLSNNISDRSKVISRTEPPPKNTLEIAQATLQTMKKISSTLDDAMAVLCGLAGIPPPAADDDDEEEEEEYLSEEEKNVGELLQDLQASDAAELLLRNRLLQRRSAEFVMR